MSEGVPAAARTSSPALQLTLATGSFAVCFAIFGSFSAMMPVLSERLRMSEFEVGVALAIPILLGSVGRIPLGILADRFGGRAMFIAVLSLSLIPAFLVPFVNSYWQLLVCGFFFGIPLSVFAVGVGFVSAWHPPHRQGTAVGIYGAGGSGQSLALFGAPFLVRHLGYAWGFWTFAIITAAWLCLVLAWARNAPRVSPPRRLRDYLGPLAERRSWELSLYYALTFGGFLAMASYLPKFLIGIFHLTKQDAGLRAGGYVLLATMLRPIGGVLADRVGGIRMLGWVFPLTAICALMMAWPVMTTFTAGALGMSAIVGLGNGAVFKLVPEYFPRTVGTVTGLVGAAGGLGGFFPPLVVGGLKQATGSFCYGFVLLSMFSAVCAVVLWRESRKRAS